MKILVIFSVFIFSIGSLAYSQQTMNFNAAMQSATEKIEKDIGSGKKVAVLNFVSSSQELSTYVIDELMDIFTNHKILEVAERVRTDAILKEREYQFSGEVGDDEIMDIGNQIGAEFIITGQLNYDGLYYRFRIYAIDIKRGTRIASTTVNIKSNDTQLSYFLGGAKPPEKGNLSSVNDRASDNGKAITPSIGLGVYTGLRFFDGTTEWNDLFKFSNSDIFVLAYFNLNLFSYVDLNIRLRYGIATRMSDDSDDSSVGNSWSLLGVGYSLLGKYPIHINKQLSVFPVFGFGLDTDLYEKSNDYDLEWEREDLKDDDSFYLELGGGINYYFNKNILFHAMLLYDIFIYSKSVSESNYKEYSMHGPNIAVGISYVF